MAVMTITKGHLKYQLKSLEKLPIRIWEDSTEASAHVAKSIALAIRQKQQEGERLVLGLATGSSPIGVYKELVRMHREENLSFSNVITFNLDEYYPMEKSNVQSYDYFMREHLFDHIDILAKNINIPNGTVANEDLYQSCVDYEMKIKAAGGIDFQLLGIGRTGHIGFNEPGSHLNSGTRNIKLDHITRVDASSAFLGLENVPVKAITMGIGTVRTAKRIVLLGWGSNKAKILKKTIEGDVSSSVPATYLQNHHNIQNFIKSNSWFCLEYAIIRKYCFIYAYFELYPFLHKYVILSPSEMHDFSLHDLHTFDIPP